MQVSDHIVEQCVNVPASLIWNRTAEVMNASVPECGQLCTAKLNAFVCFPADGRKYDVLQMLKKELGETVGLDTKGITRCDWY